jgi:uncharacterized protein with HEPN domain
VRDPRARLADILEAIAAIRRHAGRGRAVFEADELVQVWILHHLQVIGEAATRLDPSVRAASGAPWAGIVGMRNIWCTGTSGSTSTPCGAWSSATSIRSRRR